MKILIIFCIALFSISISTRAQEILELYPGAVPNSRISDIKEVNTTSPPGMYSGVTKPTLEIFLPDKDKAGGAAVIICPGGGYSVIVYQGEGVTTAREFAKNGVAAFVLKYRLPDDSTMMDKKIGPLQDVQQSFKVVRENCSKWGIDPTRIGIMGFSAGGHLASTGATHFKKPLIDNSNGTNLRPDFQILVYPVVSMQENLTHLDSRIKLLGRNPSKEDVDLFSNELQVDQDTPPAYITHAADDKLVDVDNSIQYLEQLRHHKVAVEMHIYPKGGHGFIFRRNGWMDPIFRWMKDSRWMKE